MTKEEQKILSTIIGPCLDRKTVARFFYADFDEIRQEEIKLHLIWCRNCQGLFRQYLDDLEAKVSNCLEPGYFKELFAAKGKGEKIVSLFHTLQCDGCLSRYIEARGDNKYLDEYDERLRDRSDPISKLTYLRYCIVRREKIEKSYGPGDR